MAATQITSSQYLKTLITLHSALISGQVMFAIIAYVVKSMDTFPDNTSFERILSYVLPILTVACLLGGNSLFKNRVNVAKSYSSLPMKLSAYRSAVITRDGLYEGPSLFAIIAYLLTGQLLFLVCTAAVLIAFVVTFPNKDKIIRDLELSSTEVNTLNDPNGIVS